MTHRRSLKELDGEAVLTSVWAALHVPAALLLGQLLTSHAADVAAAPPAAPAAVAEDTTPPE